MSHALNCGSSLYGFAISIQTMFMCAVNGRFNMTRVAVSFRKAQCLVMAGLDRVIGGTIGALSQPALN